MAPISCGCGYFGGLPYRYPYQQRNPEAAVRYVPQDPQHSPVHLGTSTTLTPTKMRCPIRPAAHRPLGPETAGYAVQDGTRRYSTYEFHQAYHAIHNFCVVDMSNFYLMWSRPPVCRKADGLSRRAAQTTMYRVLSTMTRWQRRFWPLRPTKSGWLCPTRPMMTPKTWCLTTCPKAWTWTPTKRSAPSGTASISCATR
ncbi:MAG: class I tRNA ligase family protein [Acutalibacteraceae bacterium]